MCTALYEDSQLMVGFGKFNDQEFVRMVTLNTILDHNDIVAFFKTLETYVTNHMLKTASL